MRAILLYSAFFFTSLTVYGQRTVGDLFIATTGGDLEKLHRLMTGESAVNYDCGPDLWQIPYIWNWEGSRKQIRKHGIFIREQDRTPLIFFRDLVDTVAYEGPGGDQFYTFGWCSEREMAFCAAAFLMGYEGIVVVFGNHAFSVVNIEGALYSIDNTFNRFERWIGEMPTPISELEIWYNRKVREQYEQLRNLSVSERSWERLVEKSR